MQFNLNLKRWVLLFVFLGMNRFVYALEDSLAVNYYFDQAQTYYERGKFSKAVQDFKKVLLLEPENISAREYLSRLGVYVNSLPPSKQQVSMREMGFFSSQRM